MQRERARHGWQVQPCTRRCNSLAARAPPQIANQGIAMVRKAKPRQTREHDVDALALLWIAVRSEAESRGRGPQRCQPTIDSGTLDRLASLGLLINEPDRGHVRLTSAGETTAALLNVMLQVQTQGGLGRAFAAVTADAAGGPLLLRGVTNRPAKRPLARRKAPVTDVLRVRIELEHVQPAIWRTLEIAADCTFFDLHVALNAAMGWQDAHLHHFVVGRHRRAGAKAVRYGSPDDDPMDSPFTERLEFEHLVADSVAVGEPFLYEYDFGDGWTHRVVVEAREPRQTGIRYPRLLDGARACPPEDCGGVPGYERLLEIVRNAHHPERAETLEWLGGAFDSEAFEPASVRFPDPRKRLKALRDGY